MDWQDSHRENVRGENIRGGANIRIPNSQQQQQQQQISSSYFKVVVPAVCRRRDGDCMPCLLALVYTRFLTSTALRIGPQVIRYFVSNDRRYTFPAPSPYLDATAALITAVDQHTTL